MLQYCPEVSTAYGTFVQHLHVQKCRNVVPTARGSGAVQTFRYFGSRFWSYKKFLWSKVPTKMPEEENMATFVRLNYLV